MSKKQGSIARTLSLVTLGVSSIVLLLVVGYGHYYSMKLLRESASEGLQEHTIAIASRLSGTFRAVELTVQNLCNSINVGSMDNTQVQFMMLNTLKTTPELLGIAVSTVTDDPSSSQEDFLPFYYRQGDKIIFADETSDKERQMTMDYMYLPKIIGHTVWTEPFVGQTLPQIMTACSMPLYRNGKLFAIVTGIVSLEEMTSDLAGSVKINEAYPLLISSTGMVLSHPNLEYVVNETIFSLAMAYNEPQLRTVGLRMLREASGQDIFVDSETAIRSLICFQRISGVNWSLALVLPESRFTAPFMKLTRTQLLFASVGMCVLLLMLSVVIHRITRPISILNNAIAEISAGHLNTVLPTVKSNDEVASLADAFGLMQQRLTQIMEELRESTAIQERIASEMQIAHSIQMGLVPRTFPPFPHRDELDLYAELNPAQDVGGDFYDFFLLDEEHIFVTIGDVSGKGVPAALFMAVTRTLIRSLAKTSPTPADLLTALNHEIAQDNESSMFVTVFCAVYSLANGELIYVSGGHNPPILLRADGQQEWLRESNGFLIGIFEDMPFTNATVRMEKGDCLVMYTDGVTEAMNANSEEFGEDRLAACLMAGAEVSVKTYIEKIDQEITLFVDGEKQSDDITIMCLRRLI